MAFRRSPVRSWSGPPSFAHECRRRMPRRSVAERREGGPLLASERASARQAMRRMSRRSRAAAEADPLCRILHFVPPAESQKLRTSRGHSAHPVNFETSAFGIAVASGLACRRPSASSTFWRVPIRSRTSTSVALRTSPPASSTTTPAAALTPRDTAPGNFTSLSNLLTSNELSISSAI